MGEFASKGLAGTALGFGIGGAAMSLANGGLNNLFGNRNAAPVAQTVAQPAATTTQDITAALTVKSCGFTLRTFRKHTVLIRVLIE